MHHRLSKFVGIRTRGQSASSILVKRAAGNPREGLAHRVQDPHHVDLLGGEAVVEHHLVAVRQELVHQEEV